MAGSDRTLGERGRATAEILLDIEAVLFRPEDPFVFTSGRASPVYVDCRRIISFPGARAKLMDMAVDLIRHEIGTEHLDAVAGGETAGIPFAAWIAERLDLPMVYVRKQPKGFGRNAQIEGTFEAGAALPWSILYSATMIACWKPVTNWTQELPDRDCNCPDGYRKRIATRVKTTKTKITSRALFTGVCLAKKK